MKRKLISFDAFESIKNNSMSTAEMELAEAAPILAKSLQLEKLDMVSFTPETVLYEALDGTFVRSTYVIKEGYINFDDIEQLAIDDETEKSKAKQTLSLMIDAVLEGKEGKANEMFDQYASIPLVKRVWKESIMSKKCKKNKKDAKDVMFGTKEKASKKAEKKFGKKKSYLRKVGLKKIQEWSTMCKNVCEYVDFQNYGPTLHESIPSFDNNGNVVAIKVPTKSVRNEGKMLSFNWKTLATDLKVLRGGAKNLSEDTKFCKAVSELKRQNAMSDNKALEEVLENVVGTWPSVLYLTQNELSNTIKSALETIGASNYDDQTCAFMAEGILRKAHESYSERVSKVLTLAGTKANEDSKDKYADFKNVADNFYPSMDEATSLEMQVFVDLYESLRNIYDVAREEGDDAVWSETATHLNELYAIIQGKAKPTLEVASNAAEWLSFIVETNLESGEWAVNNTPYITTSGEHPEMAKKAQKGYAPASDFSGNWGDAAPVSDGKSYKGNSEEMRSNSWGNIGGSDTWPELQNPYVPKPFGDYTMKGEKGVDKEEGDLATPKGSDTWPELQNPYVPKSNDPKMNNGKEEDLVVNK